MYRTYIFLFILCCIIASKSMAGVEVIVNGYTPIMENLEEVELKKNALKDAYFRAIEQGVGLFINKSTSVRNYRDVIDISLTKSQGYVKSFTEISSGIDGNMYRVTISAYVEKGSFVNSNDKEAYALFNQVVLGTPTLAIFLDLRGETILDEFSILSLLADTFREYGFDVRESNNLLTQYSYEKTNVEHILSNDSLLESINSDFLFAVKVSNVFDDSENSSEYLKGFRTANLSIGFQFVMVETGEIILSGLKDITGIGISIQQAEHVAIEKFNIYLKDDILNRIPETIVSHPLHVLLLVENINQELISDFSDGLANLPDCYSVSLLKWKEKDSIAEYKLLVDPLTGGSINVWRQIYARLDNDSKLINISKNKLTVALSIQGERNEQ